MPEEIDRRDEFALQLVARQIAAGAIQLYLNAVGRPHLELTVENMPPGNFYLRDRRVRDWLTHFVWATEGILLGAGEIDRILSALAGWAMRDARAAITDPAVLQVLETEPLVAVVVEFFETKGRSRYERTAAVMWADLANFARKRGMSRIGNKHFPRGDNVLVRKLREFANCLHALGIDFEIRRSNGSRIALSKRSDDLPVEPSPISSAPNLQAGNDLPDADDSQRRIERLQARLAHHHLRLEGPQS